VNILIRISMVVEDGKCTADLILRRHAALRLTIYSASLCLVAFLAPSIAPQTPKKRMMKLAETVCLMFATVRKKLDSKIYKSRCCQMFRAEYHAKSQTCGNTTSGSREGPLNTTGCLLGRVQAIESVSCFARSRWCGTLKQSNDLGLSIIRLQTCSTY
jgi:hypothetical protein